MPAISSLKEGSPHEKKVKPEKNGESNYNNSNNRCLDDVSLLAQIAGVQAEISSAVG